MLAWDWNAKNEPNKQIVEFFASLSDLAFDQAERDLCSHLFNFTRNDFSKHYSKDEKSFHPKVQVKVSKSLFERYYTEFSRTRNSLSTGLSKSLTRMEKRLHMARS